tara:strand:- start:96 stop:3611 length:3516 start_codon:yes stop_codon:yes gene_type:complete
MEKKKKLPKKISNVTIYNMKKSLTFLRSNIPKGKNLKKIGTNKYRRKNRKELYSSLKKLKVKQIKKVAKKLDPKFRFSKAGKRYKKKELLFNLQKYFFKKVGTNLPSDITTTPTTDIIDNFTTQLQGLSTGLTDSITIDLKKVGINNLVNLILSNLSLTSNLVLEFGNTHYTLNDMNKNKLEKLLKGNITYTDPTLTGSDVEVLMELQKVNKVRIYRQSASTSTAPPPSEGMFFKYTHNIKHPLLIKSWKSYGLFDKVKKSNYNVNCLTRAFKEGGMDAMKLEKVKLLFTNRSIPVSKFGSIIKNKKMVYTGLVDQLNININITRPRKMKGKNTTYTKSFKTHTPNENTKTYNIGLIDEHYFIIDKKTNINKYALEHYEELKDLKGFYNLKSKGKKEKRHINSYDLITTLLNNKDKLLTPITNCNELYKSTFYEKISEWGDLDYDPEVNIKEIKEAEPKGVPPKIVFFDFEASTEGKKHEPYMVCYKVNKEEIKTKIGYNCAKHFLQEVITDDTLLLAHNLSYDFQFILKHMLSFKKSIERGKQMLQMEGKYYNFLTKKTYNVMLKDTAALIAMKLEKFGECFKLEQSKEIMPYNLYTQSNIKKEWVSLYEANKILKKQYYLDCSKKQIEDKIYDFTQLAIKHGNLKNGYFNIIKYAQYYCERDVDVLYKGYNKFREWMFELTDNRFDIYDMVSITQLAHNLFISDGCYDGVYQLGGVPRAFISECIVGGRCMTNRNKKQYVKMIDDIDEADPEGTIYCNHGISDFDGVSLYPSAMSRMKGFLKGVPKVIEGDMLTNHEILTNQDGFFVEIRINAIDRELDFPLLSVKNDEGVRIFTNKLVGKVVMVDKTTLLEAVKHHKIDYTVIKGYYYNEGHNPQINTSIKKLFDARLQKKKEKNPIQTAYKLIMNSSYGRTLLKPIDREIKIIRGRENRINFQRRHFNNIISFNEINWNVKRDFDYLTRFNLIKPINEHFSIPHVGVEILSASKVIMSEVMITAQELGFHLYYTDTDSIHINMEQIEPLAKEYKRKYNRELVGKYLGQFHTDFDLKGADESKCEVYSKQLIALGKKSYIDVLVGKDKNDKEIIGHHLRMKGIPPQTLKYEADKNHKKDYVRMYDTLYQGLPIAFDLLCRKEGFACRSHFIKNKDYSYSFPDLNTITTDDYVRKVVFA